MSLHFKRLKRLSRTPKASYYIIIYSKKQEIPNK